MRARIAIVPGSALLALGLLAATDARAVPEQRCLELGADCICSERLDVNQSLFVPFDQSSKRFNPEDSDPIDGVECDGEGGDQASLVLTRSGGTVNPACAGVPMPPGHSVSWVWRKDAGGISDLRGDRVEASNTTSCIRIYHRFAADYVAPFDSPGQSQERTKNQTFGANSEEVSQGTNFQISTDTNDPDRNPSFKFNVVSSYYDVDKAGTSASVIRFQDCKDYWCRFETCIDHDAAGHVNIRQRIVRLSDPPVTYTHAHRAGDKDGRGPARPPVSRPAFVANTVKVGALFDTGENGRRYFSHAMQASRSPANEGFWIGPAEEVEGGLGGPPAYTVEVAPDPRSALVPFSYALDVTACQNAGSVSCMADCDGDAVFESSPFDPATPFTSCPDISVAGEFPVGVQCTDAATSEVQTASALVEGVDPTVEVDLDMSITQGVGSITGSVPTITPGGTLTTGGWNYVFCCDNPNPPCGTPDALGNSADASVVLDPAICDAAYSTVGNYQASAFISRGFPPLTATAVVPVTVSPPLPGIDPSVVSLTAVTTPNVAAPAGGFELANLSGDPGTTLSYQIDLLESSDCDPGAGPVTDWIQVSPVSGSVPFGAPGDAIAVDYAGSEACAPGVHYAVLRVSETVENVEPVHVIAALVVGDPAPLPGTTCTVDPGGPDDTGTPCAGGQNYPSRQACIDHMPASLAGLGPHNCQVIADGSIAENVVIDVGGTSALDPFVLTTSPVARHRGIGGSGAAIDPDQNGHAIEVLSDYTTVEYQRITGVEDKSDEGIHISANHVTIRNNVIHDLIPNKTDCLYAQLGLTGLTVENNVLSGCDRAGIMIALDSAQGPQAQDWLIRNNTIIRNGMGIQWGCSSEDALSLHASSNLLMDNGIDLGDAGNGDCGDPFVGGDYNVASSGAPMLPGANSLRDVTLTDTACVDACVRVVSLQAGGEVYLLVDDPLQVGIDGGSPADSTASDILDRARSAPDAGAFERVFTCGSAAQCDDANPCTDDACNAGVCENTANSAACDDGISCTADQCSGGVCVGSDTCPMGESCNATVDACVVIGGCISDPECDDANPCTDDACNAGVCDNTANSAACDDGISCTADQCSGGVCVGTETCPMGETCDVGADACVAGGGCTSDPECDDGVPCTDDTCSAGACSNVENCPGGQYCDLIGGACSDAPVFTAYDDLAWGTGQLASNITTITSPNGGSGQPSSGLLVDYDTGVATGVTLSLSGGEFNGGSQSGHGAEPAPGTDADLVFGGRVSGLGSISYQDAPASPLVLTLSGMDPARRYELVFYPQRASYGWDRASLVTLSGADAFSNQSSSGLDDLGAPLFSGAADPSTRLPSDNASGWVAAFYDVDPGADGSVTLTVSWDGSDPGSAYKGKYASALRVVERAAP